MCLTRAFTCSRQVISRWIRRPIKSLNWCGVLSVRRVEALVTHYSERMNQESRDYESFVATSRRDQSEAMTEIGIAAPITRNDTRIKMPTESARSIYAPTNARMAIKP